LLKHLFIASAVLFNLPFMIYLAREIKKRTKEMFGKTHTKGIVTII